MAAIVSEFASAKSFKQVEAVIEKLGATGDPAVAPVLRSLSSGDLRFNQTNGRVFIVEGSGDPPTLRDPLTGDAVDATGISSSDLKKVRVKNSIRRKISAVLSGLTLKAASAETRLRSAQTIFDRSDASALDALEAALETET
ncbi:MAG: urea ABC transporter permease subunit UrtB, partial [Pseudomonadota bacterium]